MTRRLNPSRVAGGGDQSAGKVSFSLAGEDLAEVDVGIEAPLPSDTRARLHRDDAVLVLEFEHPSLGERTARLDLSGLEDHEVYECEILWNPDRVALKLIPSPEGDSDVEARLEEAVPDP